MRALALTLALAAHAQIGIGRTVLVTVLGPRDQPILDVEADDFVVREAGEPREVLSAHIADYPLVVLLDNSAAARSDFDDIRRAATGFLARVGRRPVAIGTLGRAPSMVAGFSEDQAAVRADLEKIEVEAGRGSTLEGIAAAGRAIRALDAPFSAIVVLLAGAADTTGAPSLRDLFDSRAILHLIVRQSGPANGPSGELRALADQTRGGLTTIYSSASYAIALERLAERLAGEMMIEYIVPAGTPPNPDVTVGVRLPGVRVRGMGVR